MKIPHRLVAPLIVAAAALVACSGDSPDALLASAKEYLAEDDPKAAIIQLKTVLQNDDGGLPEARYLLGKALLASGDAPGAVVELRKALAARHPEEIVLPDLARAMNIAGELQRLTEQFGQTVLSDPLAEADLKTTLAVTYGSMGRREQAERAMEAAFKAVPDYGPAVVFQARLQADTGDLSGALAAINRQLERTPQDHTAWTFKGDLLNHGQRNSEAALAAYRQAISLKPNFVPAHNGAMLLLLANKDLEGAKAQLAELHKVLPNHPQTVYFAGNVALLGRDFDRAREIAQQLLRVAPDNPRVLQLAGAVAFETSALVQAESYLAKALQKSPENDVSRRLLTLTYLRSSQPAKAINTLQSMLERPKPDATTYMLAAQAKLQAGELDEAQQYFERAAKLNPDDTRSRTALAMGKLMTGQVDTGVAELRNLAANDDDTVADLPLISALVRRKDYDGALKAIAALEKKQPGKPIAANLRARVHSVRGDKDAARKSFEEALAIQPDFYPAAAALAQLDLADGQVDAAKKRLEDFLAKDPTNIQALMANAGLKARLGAPREEILALFNTAIRQNPAISGPRLAMINYHLANKDIEAALEAARQATAALPNNTELLEAHGRALAASGDTNQALATFNKLAQLLPTSPLPYMRLADVQWTARNRDGAVQSLKRALNIAPQYLPAQRALVDAYLADNKPDEAQAVARQIQQQRPDQDVGYLVEGGIQASMKRWDKALAIYRRGLAATASSTDLASRVHVALLASKQEAEAARHVESWTKAHPGDAGFLFYLGDHAMTRQDFREAEARYRQVLALQPENPLALNNVAWLMAAAKKPGAVELAQKASSLLPDRPALMDTLALALATEGQIEKGVEILKQATALEPKNPQLRFNLARMMVQAGDKAGAKTELQTLAELGDKFPRQREVTELLKTL